MLQQSRLTLTTAAAALLLAFAGCETDRDYAELGVAELHDRMQRGELRSEQLVNWYLDRIAAIDQSGPMLRSIVELNPDALQTARALDEEWRRSGPRGPLHGIPVVLKANIDTADGMTTTAGSLAMSGYVPAEDAFLVRRLRDAGAVLLGKSNLSEWANFRSSRSSSGWSSAGGQTRNPYDPQRSPCGSSSGSAVAVAANLATVAVGTETDGSIVCPAGINGIVGIKPTVGLISRGGIVPGATSQDTAGPMARSVRDAAILLTALTGIDPDDEATTGAEIHHDYAANLTADALRDKRIGVIRSWYGAGSNPAVDALFDDNIARLESAGAIIVDDIRFESDAMYDAEYTVMLYELKAGLNAYLESSGAPIGSFDELIAFNEANAATVMPHFGQEFFLEAQAAGELSDADYGAALAAGRRLARHAINDPMNKHQLDALIAPTNGPAWMIDLVNGDAFSVGSSSLAAISGYPSITVPAGFVAGLPIGLSFIGGAWNEKQLIEIAYAWEQTTEVRTPPAL